MQGSQARLLVAIGFAAAAACKGGRGGGQDVELVVVRGDLEIPVTVGVPDGWAKSPHGSNVFRPADHSGQPGLASWSLWTDCYGSCSAESIAGNVDNAIKGQKRAAMKIAGSPEAQGSAQLDVIAEKDLEGGKQLAYRVTYTGEPPSGYRERVSVYCAHYRPGDPYFVVFEASAPLADEDEYLEDFLAACESVRIGEAEVTDRGR